MPARAARRPALGFTVLQRSEQIDLARGELVRRGLSEANEWGSKVWDVEATVAAIEASVGHDQAILDLGAVDCAVLPVLHRLGYQRLYGIDLDPQVLAMPYADAIRYSTQNMYATDFDDGSFAAISAVSVIEHGLHTDSLWREVARLLRPGGMFLFSTDYWPRKVDTSEIALFNLPWTIFSAEEIVGLVAAAAGHGLVPQAEFETALRAVDERVIQYAERDYTFLFGALVRAARPRRRERLLSRLSRSRARGERSHQARPPRRA